LYGGSCVLFPRHISVCVCVCLFVCARRRLRTIVYDLSSDRATIVQLIAQCSHGDIRGIVERCELAFFIDRVNDLPMNERVVSHIANF
jgi:hypothetical protein